MLGGAYGKFVGNLFPTWTGTTGAYGIVGMCALVAATTHAPITAIIIIVEMTNNYTI
ncbi:unnamed protein product, partial [marine sediment metagenome]